MNSGMLFHRPPMLTKRLTVETVTAITRRSGRRIKDGHTSTSNPHHPLSLSSSFTFRRGHEQLTSAAAHRPPGSVALGRCGCVLYCTLLPSIFFLHRALLLVMRTVLSTRGGRKKCVVPDNYPWFSIPHPPLDFAALVDVMICSRAE